MYLCIGVALVGMVSYLVCIKTGRRKDLGIYFLILMVSGVFGVLICLQEDVPDRGSADEIRRPEPGNGTTEEEYVLSVEDLSIEEPYRITVENRHLTKGELEELFGEAVEELERTFLGENESLDRITRKVVLADSIMEGRIDVSWSFDNYEAVNLSGELQEDALKKEGTLVEVTATLVYEETQLEHRFSMMVYPPEKTKKELFYERLEEDLDAKNRGTGDVFLLPKEVAGHALVWERKKDHTPYTILLLGLCAMAGVAIGKKEDLRKAKKNRDEMLMAEYPQMLSQLALLLGAGMTVSNAWERMVLNYENRRAGSLEACPEMPVYEEMRITYHQMKDGVGERMAYEQFGERLGLQAYRRLATLLVQNLRKGTAGLCRLLEKEMQDAFDARESDAKKRGEELQTKLLLPMMLMLGLVIVIIMIPAIAGFRVQ